MPFIRLFYHLVWTTKNRLAYITPENESRLFAYIRQKANELELRILAINGWCDHIHLIIEIPPKVSVAEAVKQIKGTSSHEFPELYWQRGYGAITVSERNLSVALEYVNRQKEHHAQLSAIPRLERCDEETEQGMKEIREDGGLYFIDDEGAF